MRHLKRLRAALVFYCLLATGPLQAAIVSADFSTVGDGLLTRDTSTGLEWLDLTATQGESYDSVEAGFGGYTTTHGFRHATRAEVETLWTNFGLNTSMNGVFDAAQHAIANTLIDTVGSTLSNANVYSTLGWLDFIHGTSGDYNTTRIDAYFNTDEVYANVGYARSPSNTANPNVGNWLVRDSTATIPLVPANLLLIIGLLGVFWHRRHH